MRDDGVDRIAFPATIHAFQRSIAMDSVRNEYTLHSRLHLWFTGGAAALDLDALNARVYAELFLTPRNDPWLGLVSPGTYSALGASAWAGR
jgi:hypothetical protein